LAITKIVADVHCSSYPWSRLAWTVFGPAWKARFFEEGDGCATYFAGRQADKKILISDACHGPATTKRGAEGVAMETAATRNG